MAASERKLEARNQLMQHLRGMTDREIQEEAARILDELPQEFRERLDNIAVVVRKRPSQAQVRAIGLDPHTVTVYGLYEGVPLAHRSTLFPPVLPDKITIFSEPLLRDFPDPDQLREQIRITIIHEIAHFFGMDDEKIDKLGY